MEQKMKVVVLGANRYSFEDRSSKREVEGCKVHYISLDDQGGQNQIGMIPLAENMDYGFFNKLGKVPGIYEATISNQIRGRKLVPVISDFSFIEEVTFELPVKA